MICLNELRVCLLASVLHCLTNHCPLDFARVSQDLKQVVGLDLLHWELVDVNCGGVEKQPLRHIQQKLRAHSRLRLIWAHSAVPTQKLNCPLAGLYRTTCVQQAKSKQSADQMQVYGLRSTGRGCN